MNMYRTNFKVACSIALVTLIISLGLSPRSAEGQNFTLDWHPVDVGGLTPVTWNGFELNATIAQTDAWTMSEAGWELRGGFWAAARQACRLSSDMIGDGKRDALDVQGFADCMVTTDSDCTCAQPDGIARFDVGDVAVFVAGLLFEEHIPIEGY